LGNVNDLGYLNSLYWGILALKVLKNFYLRSGQTSLNGVRMFGELLSVNKSIESLALDNYKFPSLTNTSILVFGQYLFHNDTLKELYIWGNKIGCTSAELIAKVLMKNNSIQTIHIDGQIRDKGAYHLGEMLKKNSSLKNLNLIGNKITNIGARYILEGCKHNTTLKKLSLYENDLTEAISDDIIDMKKVNKSIDSIGYYCSNFD